VVLEQLYRKYKDRVEFLMVYVREAHPNSILFVPADGGGKMLQVIGQTSTEVERLKHLQLCASYLQLTMPALVDSKDNLANRAHAAFPSRFYIVDKEGKIASKGEPGPGGFRPADVEAWLSANVK